MTLRACRDRIQAVLTPALGTMTLPNSATTPAMWVGNWDGPFPGTVVTGILAVLDIGSMDVIREYQQEKTDDRLRLDLIAWGAHDPETAVSLLIAAFEGSDVDRARLPEGWGPTGWVTVYLSLREVLG